ncbi:signal peptidase I [Euhalothece natronophila Z-M001]|uniref:Signal peptidase I n=1 Tax=Euhalothece natronophila Z-M001 TaxID=522448 RepID=A0A5B8NJ62_9CHRO|nr:signal peptidase I [Euhalothece natronophila]QDZ38521.1 signal peptidase I [Euhalothece natronophila Z-M001]
METSESSIWKQIWENIKAIAIALLIATLIRVFIAEPRYIPSDSMLPTLEIGDRIVVEKVSYYFQSPQQQDIVVFNPSEILESFGYDSDQAFIKRVIGEGENTLAVKEGQVYINGEVIEEPYIKEPPNYELPPLTVPRGKLFVLGDNRNNSNDSHIWGFLPKENVIGRAVFRFWPPDRVGFISIPQEDVSTHSTASRNVPAIKGSGIGVSSQEN